MALRTKRSGQRSSGITPANVNAALLLPKAHVVAKRAPRLWPEEIVTKKVFTAYVAEAVVKGRCSRQEALMAMAGNCWDDFGDDWDD